MFGRGKRNRDAAPRGGIDVLAAEDDILDGGIPDDAPDGAMDAMAEPDTDAQAESDPAADSPFDDREARFAADRAARLSDQKRQAMFACACVAAGFCGVVGVIFGTAAVCSRIGQPMQSAVAGPPGAVAGQTGQEIYYDAGGQMHVNVHISREKDKDVNVYIDADGNVTAEVVEREDQPQEGEPPGGTQTEPAVPGDSQGPGGDGGDTADPGKQPPDTGASGNVAAVPKTEEELLAEMADRKDVDGSGYLPDDVTYVVIHGDTLSEISGRTGFSVDFLAAYNGLANKNLIITGETLRYPSLGGGN